MSFAVASRKSEGASASKGKEAATGLLGRSDDAFAQGSDARRAEAGEVKAEFDEFNKQTRIVTDQATIIAGSLK